MKKYFRILVVTISFISCDKDTVEHPGAWVQLQNFPGEASRKGITFSILGKGYYGLMENSSSNNVRDIWAYDSEADSWEQKNDFPFELTIDAAVTINDKGYVITQSGNLYEYDPLIDSWKYLSTSPVPNRFGLSAFALGGNAYFGTGLSTLPDENGNYPFFKDFWKYDPIQNEWTQVADYPGEARAGAISFVIGSNAYVGLGFLRKAPPIFNDLYSYDAITGTWDRMADLPITSAIGVIQFSSEIKGYVGLPQNKTGLLFEYSPTDDAWRNVKPFPIENLVDSRSFLLNNRNFVVGGWITDHSKQVWEFLP